MAAFDNPFYIQPVSPLQALMTGVGAYQSGVKSAKESAAEAANKRAAGLINSGDWRGALSELIGNNQPESVKALAAVRAADTKADTTESIKNYELAKKDPAFAQFMIDQARAKGVKVEVNPGEKEYEKNEGARLQKEFGGYLKAGQDAIGKLTSYNIMRDALKTPGFYSGTGAENIALPAKRAIAAMGGDPNAAASMETFNAFSKKAIVDALGGSLGAGVSNADVQFLQGQVPSLQNTPEGNTRLLDIQERLAKRDIEVAKKAREYAAKKGKIDTGFQAELADWAAKNPLFPEAQRGAPAAPAGPSGQSAPRQAPDGKWYIPDPNRPGKYLQVVQ